MRSDQTNQEEKNARQKSILKIKKKKILGSPSLCHPAKQAALMSNLSVAPKHQLSSLAHFAEAVFASKATPAVQISPT